MIRPSLNGLRLQKVLHSEVPPIISATDFDRTPLKQLLDALKKLGRSSCKEWPFPPAELNHSLLQKLMSELQYQKQISGVSEPGPEQWREAIGSTLLKEYRGNKEIYAWLKSVRDQLYPLPVDQERWVDTSALKAFIASHPDLDIELVTRHFWQLSRSVSSAWFNDASKSQSLTSHKPSRQQLDSLCQCLVAIAPEDTERLQFQGQGQPESRITIKITRHRALENRLREYYFERYVTRQQPIPAREQMTRTANALFQTNTQKQRAAVLKQALEPVQQSVMPKDDKHWVELSQYLLSGQRDWSLWNKKRQHRLMQAVRQHRIISLTGEAGSGKSYNAQWVAERLNPHQKPITFTGGPDTSSDDLFGRQVLVPKPLSNNC